jgi:hypothetical protein
MAVGIDNFTIGFFHDDILAAGISPGAAEQFKGTSNWWSSCGSGGRSCGSGKFCSAFSSKHGCVLHVLHFRGISLTVEAIALIVVSAITRIAVHQNYYRLLSFELLLLLCEARLKPLACCFSSDEICQIKVGLL